MIKSKLTISGLMLLLSMTQLIAEPAVSRECCKPAPVGGIEALVRNAFYPAIARDYRFEADVTLNFQVDVLGNVSEVRVTESGGSMFDESAISAVLNTEWSPAMQNGTPVTVTYEIPFEYRTQ